jgi:hypothetical protein
MLFELKEMATEPVPHVMKATCPGVECRDAIVVVAGRQQINLPTALGDACSHVSHRTVVTLNYMDKAFLVMIMIFRLSGRTTTGGAD